MNVSQVVAAVAVLSMFANLPWARAGEGFTSFGPKEAERRYDSAVKQAKQTYLTELRRALSSMPATQIDEANRINAVIKRLEVEIAGRPAEPGTESQSTNDTIKILIGKWELRGPNGFRNVLTFKENGTVLTPGPLAGKWEVKEDRVLMNWNSGDWDAFRLPLDKNSTVSDSSVAGPNFGTAIKIGK